MKSAHTQLLATTWLDWILGRDPGIEGTPTLQWANVPESWGVFVLLAIVGMIVFGVFWFYRREMDVCPRPVKTLLAVIRMSVLLLLVVLFLKPSVFFQQVDEIKRTIPLLRDSSLSIARTDQYRDNEVIDRLAEATGIDRQQIADGDADRAAILNALFANQPSAMDTIRDKGAIQVMDFADGTSTIAVLPSKDASAPEDNPDSDIDSDLLKESMPPLQATGLGTDLYQALRTSLDNASKISAIVIASDFQHNGSENPLEMARRAASLDIPIYTIGLGDPNPPRNVSVTDVYVRNKAYPDEPFEIEALLQTSHLADQGIGELIVTLDQRKLDSQTGQPGPPQRIETRNVPLPDSGGRIRVDFEHVLTLPGKYQFTVSASPVEQEVNLADNERISSEFEIIDEQVRVLLVSGLPSWDFQQVQRLFQRDPSISLSCWLQSQDQTRPQEGDNPITRLPQNMAELGEYNVVIMMDPNPEEFDRQWIDLLKQFCRNKAGGVMFIAGRQFTSEFVTMNRLSGIRELLPVRFGDVEFIDTSQILAQAATADAVDMSVVNHNLDHAVMSFRGDAGENQKIWSAMPGIFWSFPAFSAKPTARVLLENAQQINADGNQPLLVSGRFGAGSVLYMGFQGTYRWRRVGLQAQYFDRFWIQVIRFLVETRSLQGSRRGFIDTDKNAYELGERITVIARVLDSQFQPSVEPEVTVELTIDGERTQTLKLKQLPQQPGRYEGTLVAQRIGAYEMTLKFDDTSVSSGELVDPIGFRIIQPSVESGTFWLNEKLMREIAEQSGGRSFGLDQLDELAATLPRISEKITFKSPPKPIWDINYMMRILAFILPVFLLCAEWAIRKWYKLL